VSHLPLLTTTERQQLLVDWNETAGDSLPTQCVHELFEEQVARTPEAIAVVFDDQQLTYAALNARANQLAHFLMGNGVGQEVRVGICLERSLELAISLLGALKAGGAYVPLDPSYPPERLSLMLEDTQTRIVVTHTDLQLRIPQRQALNVYLDQIEATLDCADSKNPIHSGNMEQMAYVIFTSGSTGRPKGVAVCHRTLVNLIVWQEKTRRTPCNGTTLQFASFSFDVSSQEILSTWCAGGRLLVISEFNRMDFPYLLDTLNREMVDRVFLPLVALQHIAALAQEKSYSLVSLREVITAGEQLKISEAIIQLFSQFPNRVLVNHYGPSESHVVSSYQLENASNKWPILPPIGRPIDNTQLYLLNAYFEPVPLRVIGELYIGGIGLARCYLNRPDLTAERFVPSPYTLVPGARLYRTGDFARYRPDGALEFQGRVDHQVKIRGYRIECGEIETILSSHPTIREVLVLPREDGMGNKRLVAYIVLERGSIPNISEFRVFLSLRLPAYMVPSGFVFLDTFPLSSNGKVDRRKLPVEGQGSTQEEGTYVAPRNSLERQLMKIWETVLGKQPIGVTDNFFNLGGESLMAVRLCSEMERALQTKIPVPLIFHAQTIEQLAKIIGKSLKYEQPSLLVPIQLSGSNPPIFCFGFVSNFRRYLKDYREQPIYMFLSPGEDGRPILNRTVEKIAALCIKEMRTVQPEGPYYVAGFSFGGLVVYEMAQQLRKQGETIGLLALIDPTTPLSKPASPERKIRLNHLLSTTRHQINKVLTNLNTISPSIFTKIRWALQWRLKKKIRPFEFKLKKLLCKVYFGFGYPLPVFLRQFYRINLFIQIAKQYSPLYYPGQVVIFQTNISVGNYWSKLCAEVEKIYDLPCKHMEIHKDGSHVPRFLHQLMDCLEKRRKNMAKAKR
jgi:amino acid adenylation domain-containing protein